MPSETVSDGIFIVINKNQDKAASLRQYKQYGTDSLGASAP
ncbi:hypothetical protein [Neisseria meningitidis]|nr:hypothetical protein [Neisseria meningitidis]